MKNEESISDLHSLFEVMRNSRNKLLTIFDLFPDGIVMLDSDYKIIHVNRSRANFVNKEPKDLVGKHCYKEFVGIDEPCADCPVSKTFKSGKEENSIMFQHRGNVEYVFEVNAFPQKKDNGEIFSAIEYTKDVTEQKMLEERLLQSEKLAFLGEMAAGMGHELMNPLSGISMSLQDIANELTEDSSHQETFKLIFAELERMERFIKQLLKISVPAPLVLAHVNIHKDILEHVLFLIWNVVRKYHFQVERRYSESLPSITLDQGQIFSVFLNIISNSFKAMKGAKDGKLIISTKCVNVSQEESFLCNDSIQAGKMLEIRISDNGCGIMNEDINKIYEPFFSKLEGGFGLGLATTRKIIKKHNGSISVESKYGKGTTFIVRLPFSSEGNNMLNVEDFS